MISFLFCVLFTLCNHYWKNTYNRKNSKKARELWWMGIPPSVRGKVWKLAIGNELNLTSGRLTTTIYYITRK